MPTIDPRKIIAGFRGKFYWGDTGDPMGECRSWEVVENVETTDEGVLDDVLTYPVFQGASFSLSFTQLTITDEIPRRMIEAARNKKQLWMRFIGEITTEDARTGRYVIDMVTPDGSTRLFAAERGATMSRDFSWKCGAIPDVPAYLT